KRGTALYLNAIGIRMTTMETRNLWATATGATWAPYRSASTAIAIAPPGIEAKNVDFPSTPEARLKVNAPRPPTKKTATVAAAMAGKGAAKPARTAGVK